MFETRILEGSIGLCLETLFNQSKKFPPAGFSHLPSVLERKSQRHDTALSSQHLQTTEILYNASKLSNALPTSIECDEDKFFTGQGCVAPTGVAPHCDCTILVKIMSGKMLSIEGDTPTFETYTAILVYKVLRKKHHI